MTSRPTVLQFGAGNVGRGFTGQLFTDAGYEVVFADVVPEIVEALERRRAYPLELVGPDRFERREVQPVRAVDARHVEAVAEELARCAFACTAVGAPALARLVPALAAGLRRRPGSAGPLNVILCENQWRAAELLREQLRPQLGPEALERLGLVESVVSRMVPILPEEERRRDPLRIVAEDYARLPIDRRAWLGPLPPVPALQPVENFPAWFDRKLYVHNLGHAVAAYFGYAHGCTWIHEAMRRPEVREAVCGAMEEAGRALDRKHGFSPAETEAHRRDLLRRFENPALRDTVQRVGRDPARKLAPQDRLVGAALTCLDWGVEPEWIARGIAAALRFDPPEDPGAQAVQAVLRAEGVAAAFRRWTGQPPEGELGRRVLEAWERWRRAETEAGTGS